jgi:hypothetical protein
MTADPPIVIAHPIDSDIRLIQIGPGCDPAREPLLSHAGLACEVGGEIRVAMNGMTGITDTTRQFLTTADNDLTEEVLVMLADELSDPLKRASAVPLHRRRVDQIRTDLDHIVTLPEGLMDPPTPVNDPSDDTPEP